MQSQKDIVIPPRAEVLDELKWDHSGKKYKSTKKAEIIIVLVEEPHHWSMHWNNDSWPWFWSRIRLDKRIMR